ncbi:hypothetical protein [Piscinibacter sp. XHJ-5]|uniref:hypothetical protein n=1 Tax=Piscinibacter sp. XHJ-5 TaxID=3037797 RepID=UPI002452F72D|nr:hypothetical protein [Piscinibacter sp. XHJ-5]
MSQVAVRVNGDQVSVDIDDLKMGKLKNETIKWNLQTQGWTFPSDGIVIHDNDGQFTDFKVNGGGKVFSCVDANTNTKNYKYDVKVTDGKRVLVLDPTIGNEGP